MRRLFWFLGRSCCFLLLVSLAANSALAQLETATVSGQVVDPSGLSIHGAQVRLVDIDRNTTTDTATNPSGLYTFPSVRPGRYRMEVTAAGFKIINVTGLTVNVQDHLEQNFKLTVGAVSESVTVEGGAAEVNTESAAVSTVVDRQFAENLPLNGRSFQTLIQMTPGVVTTASNFEDGGQFSINGQRAASNYWMVDGVSANIGTGLSPTGNAGNGLAGALGSFSVLGGTNSLVSVDALQEFRIQTSTYAPEFGRTPGGQISIVTRSGANQFHGTVFDYFRNDVLDANNWFNSFSVPSLPKAEERQNDFGGTFSGPILKNRTFFFFSYEGLRLRLPQTSITTVPDLTARQNATPGMQPFLNSFPFDPSQPDLGGGIAQFNASYSNPATLDAYSIRIDHNLNNNIHIFGRYNDSPSEISVRGTNGSPLSDVSPSRIATLTATAGATWTLSPTVTNDLRFNYSRTTATNSYYQDTFGGAVPIASLPFPPSFSSQNGEFSFFIVGLRQGFSYVGQFARNLQRQINVVDGLSMQRGTHSLKFGVDFRRLSPVFAPPTYTQEPIFFGVSAAEGGTPSFTNTTSSVHTTFLLRDLGVYAQDTWRVLPRLTLTYGLRWDVSFVPRSISGPNFPAVTGFNLNDISELALAPAGTAPYATRYGNVAPRLGVAYQIYRRQNWETVVRGGFGVFYDLPSSELGNQIGATDYPFGATSTSLGGTFPMSVPPAPPTIAPPPNPNSFEFQAIDPHLQSPYTLEWNFALEQGLGNQQKVSVSYVGAAGRRLLLSTAALISPNPTFPYVTLVTNLGSSDYDALQMQYERRLSRGLQILASYTWSHSIDSGSAGSVGVPSNTLVPSSIAGSNRGPSDFDIRNTFTAGVTYDVPAPAVGKLTKVIVGGWSTDNFILAGSAQPVDVNDSLVFGGSFNPLYAGDVRPDVIPGTPLYLFGAACATALQAYGSLLPGQGCPGGKGINPAAFTNPPTTPAGCVAGVDSPCYPARQGDLGRNALRGFGVTQWDFAVHREFPIHELLKLQFRAEMFNVLNHPNFGPPNGQLGNGVSGGFGVSSSLFGQSLSTSGATAAGAQNPLYAVGGPRSIQLALKLTF
jgi:hypothetical protein